MPGTPTTLTWWSNHIVGNQGYLMCDGALVSAYNGTFLLTLDGTYTSASSAKFKNDAINPPYGLAVIFGGTAPLSYRLQVSTSGGYDYTSHASEAALLASLRDGESCSIQTANMPSWPDFTYIWMGTCLDGGCGGEPHFVGFDQSRFDYQGVSGHWYTLMDCPMLRISAEFLELNTGEPAMEGLTWITQMRIRIGDDRSITLQLSDFPDEPTVIPREKTLSLDRGLVQPIQTIIGEPTGAWVRKFPGGELVVTCLTWDKIKFLNLSIRLIDLSPEGLTGILGQTLQPHSKRLPNDSFDESI